MARGLTLFLVLPNTAFLLLGQEFFINRALINCDYLFVWIAACYLSRRTTVALYVGLFVLDVILSTESIYHFSTVETIVMVGELLEFYPAASFLIAGALLVLAIVALAMIRRRGIIRPLLSKRGQMLVGAAALVLSAATVARSVESRDAFAGSFGDGAIVASGVIETVLSSYRLATSLDQSEDILLARGAATTQLARDISRRGKVAGPNDIVVILVESQGLLKNEGDMNRALAPLIDSAIQKRYTVHRGAVHFYGSTMFGEMRILCRIYMPYAMPTKLPGLERCLPNLLGRLGYETISFHGYRRWFYQRDLWYPKVGFQRVYFMDEMKQLSAPGCGTLFPGICDLWIAGQVEQELLTPRKKRKLIYWLTLNSHLPVDSRLASESSFDCGSTETLRGEVGPCELARIHFHLYTRIAQLMLNEKLPATRFIIVGDHMPPFQTISERALYDNEQVPFVELIPRATSQPNG